MKTDTNRIFLEDVGEIVMSRGGKDIWLVKGITQHEALPSMRKPIPPKKIPKEARLSIFYPKL